MISDLRGKSGVMTFADTLAAWPPPQRWYAGGGSTIRDLAITAAGTLAAGDPELRHLVITVSQNGEAARYQVPVGVPTHMPEPLRHPVIGPAGSGAMAYDALHDPALTRILLGGIREQRSLGPLRFVREPGAIIDPRADSLVMSGEQSNTSLTFGEPAILKVLRRRFPGPHPNRSVTRAPALPASPP